MIAKRKAGILIVPLITIVLCVAALGGVAYAIQSKVVVENNTLAGEEYVIEVYDNAGTPEKLTGPISMGSVVDLYSQASITAADTGTVTVKGAEITNAYKGMLTLKDTDLANGSYTSAQLNVAVNVTSPVGGNGSLTYEEVNTVGSLAGSAAATSGSIGYTITAGLYTDAACNTPFTGDATVTASSGMITLYYKVSVSISGDGIVFSNVTIQNDVTAVKNALAREKFTLAFTAGTA